MAVETATTRRTEAWHALDGEEALAALESGPEGLTAAEAAARLARHGPNRIAPEQREAAAAVLWRQLPAR
jgi:Cation transporter/ATPase, N-terminus